MSTSISRNKEIVRARWMVGLATGLTLLLYFAPHGSYVIYPLMLFSTWAHELGHGLTAILMGGRFLGFEMWPDGSGVARHSGNYGNLALAAVAAGGLVGPPILAAAFFGVSRSAKLSRYALYAFGLFSLVTTVLFVKNGFGVLFALVLAAGCLAIAWFFSGAAAQFVLVFLAIQLSLSVFSRGDYLFKEYAQTSVGSLPSDVTQISESLFGPYWIWGGLLGVFSVAVLLGGAVFFLRGLR